MTHQLGIVFAKVLHFQSMLTCFLAFFLAGFFTLQHCGSRICYLNYGEILRQNMAKQVHVNDVRAYFISVGSVS